MCLMMLHTLRPKNKQTFTLAIFCILMASCADLQRERAGTPVALQPVPVSATYSDGELVRRAETDRLSALEREVERLKMDLERAEDALIAVESKLRTGHSRAAAVSALAEAHMQLNRASRVAPWQSKTISEARDKLKIAQKHIDEGYFGTAVFFVYRANRMVEDLRYEASIIENSTQAMFINRPKVNLRSGPSTHTEVLRILVEGTPVVKEKQMKEWVLVRTLGGAVGWIHRTLLTSKAGYKA